MNVERWLAPLSAALLLAACAAGPIAPPSTPIPSATPARASPSTAASSAVPTVLPYGPVTLVAGTETCDTKDWAPTTDPDGTWHRGIRRVSCTDATDDPRVSGTLTVDAHTAGSEDTHDSPVVQWGGARLASADGAWEGLASGVSSLDRGDTIVVWYAGTGAYAGLSYFELITGDGPWNVQGQIIPGDPPDPYTTVLGWGIWSAWPEVESGSATQVTGSAVCPGMRWDWTIDPDGTRHVRDDYHPDRCTITTDDPRVSGSRTSTWNIDLWGSPKADSWALAQWGTPRLENEQGSWEGFATGVASSRDGDVIVNWYTGSGAYAGLAYFELWTGSGPWAIQGQIFPGDPPTP